jgi:hypothetical protein
VTDDRFALALKHQTEGRQDEARRLFAEIGGVEALTALGQNLLTRPPIRSYEGVQAIVEAANKGGAEAVRICGAMAALGAGLPQNWDMALGCLQASAERGCGTAQDELRLLAGGAGSDWQALRDRVDLRGLLVPGMPRAMHERPRIQVIENFLKGEFCDWMIGRAGPKMARARTFEESSGGVSDARDNDAAEFNFVEIDLVLALIRARIGALTGLPAGLENTQVLHYARGERFAPHYDYLDPKNSAVAQSLAQAGQRAATFLIYLNDDFDGAETAFLKLGWNWRGRKGDAILFWNVDETGAPDPMTLHAGLAPTRGEKWLLSQWIRQAPGAAR